MCKKLIFAIVICFILIILTGCTNKEYNIEDKITEEIKYMENEMIGITNNFASGNYLRKENSNQENNRNDNNSASNEEIIINEISAPEINTFDFDKLMKDTRKIEEASNRMMVDLATQNVDNGEITNLSDGINKMITAISNQDEMRYLVELNNVFSLFPNFEAKISTDSDKIFERRLKYFTISSYISFLVGDKELSKTQIYTLESEYLNKQKDVKYVEEHEYNLNKIYLLIEELKKAIETDSAELVKEKYLLLIKEI